MTAGKNEWHNTKGEESVERRGRGERWMCTGGQKDMRTSVEQAIGGQSDGCLTRRGEGVNEENVDTASGARK